MPEYIITTLRDRNLIIKSDRFLDTGSTYEFTNGHILVASVPKSPEILAVAEYDEAFQADFYTYDDPGGEDEDLEDDVCDDCRTAELLEDPAFCNAVFDLIEGWHEHDIEPPEVEPSEPEPEVAQPAGATPKYPVEYRKTSDGPQWGITDTEQGHFVPFGAKEDAEDSAVTSYAQNQNFWYVEKLSDCPLVEVPHVN
jgi:hypothetical protein